MANGDGVLVGFGIGTILVVGCLCLFGCPSYHVYTSSKSGEAELAQANYNRQIKVAEAKAFEESAHSLANAEVIRANGVAAANKIIGESLKDNESYLRWLWIEGLKENGKGDTVIYIPTEAGLPILEANRFNKTDSKK